MKLKTFKNTQIYQPKPVVKNQRKWPVVFLVSAFLFMAGCTDRCNDVEVELDYAGGNFSSLNNTIIWTSNRNELTIPSSIGTETFNIFKMDADSSNREQLTDDTSVINQHPVFTPDGDQIVWVHGNSLWIMNLDGSSKSQLTTPPTGEADGHPWAGADGYVYFARVLVRLQPPFEVHKIWRVKLNGTDETEIIGGEDKDRFHPNLHRDKNQIVYTAGPPGSGMGTEIRVFNLSTNEDTLVLGRGSFSAAILHPEGKKFVLAQDSDGNQNYEIAEYEFPSGKFIRKIDDLRNNTTPYYEYPAGLRIVWIGQPDRALQSKRTRHLWLEASEPRALTDGPFENTYIVGEIAIDSTTGVCIPRPVGCFPTPPPCQQVLLPGAIANDAEELGRATARAHKDAGDIQDIPTEGYLTFTTGDLNVYLNGEGSHVTEELQQRAQNLTEFLSEVPNNPVSERVADFYVNSYFAEASKGGEE